MYVLCLKTCCDRCIPLPCIGGEGEGNLELGGDWIESQEEKTIRNNGPYLLHGRKAFVTSCLSALCS